MSEWEQRERREGEEERRVEADELGVGEVLPLLFLLFLFLFLLHCLSFSLFAVSLVRFYFLRTSLGGGRREPAMCRHHADSGQENRTVCIPPSKVA